MEPSLATSSLPKASLAPSLNTSSQPEGSLAPSLASSTAHSSPDSLPVGLVEDQIASMRLRAQKEGVADWDDLPDGMKLQQVLGAGKFIKPFIRYICSKTSQRCPAPVKTREKISDL